MLELSPDEFRRFGYQVIDALAEHLDRRDGQPVWQPSSPDLLDLPFQEEARPFEELLRAFFETIVPNTLRVTHPRFFGYVPVPGNGVSALAETLAASVNIFAGTWQSGAGAAVVEAQTIQWLCREIGLPDSAGGLTVSGGSQANLTGLAVAIHKKLGGVREDAIAYFSDQTHSAVERALRVLAFTPSQLRKVPSNKWGRIVQESLEQAVRRDEADGLRPFCVIANAGTTSAGAVDPLDRLADFCRDENLWLHADAAYGGAAVICDRGRKVLKGLERADSLALDPHKWLFQPMDLGCVLVRDDADLVGTFRIMPDYLRDVYRVEPNRNYCDRGIELTRPFRALKLWMSLQVFGVAAFRKAVEWGFHLAEVAELRLRQSRRWEVLTPAQMAIVTFRLEDAGDDAQLRLVDELRHDGFALLTSTTVHNRAALRLCTINPRTTEQDVVTTIERLEELASK
jgi:aromatic-L-amino-acid/L-tryptophan decarboxylase